MQRATAAWWDRMDCNLSERASYGPGIKMGITRRLWGAGKKQSVVKPQITCEECFIFIFIFIFDKKIFYFPKE